MALLVLKNAFVSVNSVDLSDHVKQVTLKNAAESLDNTAMSATYKSKQAGLKEWSVEVEFYQDFAAAKVDATLNGLLGAAAFPIEVRPDAGAASTTNPKYTGNVVLLDYEPFGGSVGDLVTTKVTFEGAGTMTRATA